MPMTILLVEDHGLLRAALADVLRLVYPGATIAEAATGAQALRLSLSQAPSLVLLDVGLPDANGIDLIPQIKALAPDCRIVVVSQYAAPPYAERALAAGASAYVKKELVGRELLPALGRTLAPLPEPR